MSVQNSSQWERAQTAAWHGVRCERCRKPAQRVLILDHFAMREVLLQQIEACMQARRGGGG